jgi:hypothetical protein
LSAPGRIRRFLRGRHEKPAPETGTARPDRESEVNYFGIASVLIDLHGANARNEAARLRQEALLEHDPDDPEASRDWLIVERAIVLLTADSAAARN